MPALQPWSACAARLIDVAMGRAAADLVVRGGRWVNVHSGEIIPGTDVAIAAGRFAFVGADARHAIGERTKVIEADGRRWAIDGGPDGATCNRVRSRPDLTTDHASLGALLFGGVRPSALAAGRRLEARNSEALRRADVFFLTSPLPHCQTYY